MEIADNTSIGSNEAQYARSSDRSDPASQPSSSPRSVRSVLKPVAREGVMSSALLSPGSGEGSQNTHDSHSVVFSDVESLGKPPKVDSWSDDGHFFPQRIEGAPQPGALKIEVRNYTTPSRGIIAVFQLALVPGTTVGDLLEPVVEMEPFYFYFKKIGGAYLGCRDFISQATAKWLQAHILGSGEAKQVLGRHIVAGECPPDRTEHIFTLLGWRYTNPTYGGDDSEPGQRHDVRIPNLIDRAVWPNDFVHLEDGRLEYPGSTTSTPTP
ncbi:hypothetical protein FA13DRAFT_1887921 [Coprinellus micaceus]|uniref:Uncharacterized protein n=1 Tax=Coprinellus micaceus TaxID=71717 RepID=A0A4Y7SXU4_COPMI|nr:hypothetical protein FA13DRAFT_1887921 [Coprinellus micaceus]